jgi:hypothetical protein
MMTGLVTKMSDSFEFPKAGKAWSSHDSDGQGLSSSNKLIKAFELAFNPKAA